MFDVLLESRATHQRRTGGTITSALVHGALIAAAVALAVTRPVTATSSPVQEWPVWTTPAVPMPDRGGHTPTRSSGIEAGLPAAPTIGVDVVPPDFPPIDVGTVAHDDLRIGAPGATPIGADALALGGGRFGAGGEAVPEHLVDRLPRLLGAPIVPRYPISLQSAGITGHVVAEFVVDTLGRVEMDDVRIPVASHELFAQAVRGVLPRYRFTPGEAGGRKVRTRVQMPFDFTITR